VIKETLTEARQKMDKAIEVARDNFSAWLEPHESPTTDVILVGHSMGGLLAGEVVLMVREPRRLLLFMGCLSTPRKVIDAVGDEQQ